MTSGNFAIVPISSITVDRDNRQRRELTGIEELAASIRDIGLINPIVVDRSLILIAGERRYTACKSLGLTEIPVQYIEDLSPIERQLIELEENVRRIDLPWQDYVNSMAAIHALKQEQNPDWGVEDTAAFTNTSIRHTHRALFVHRNLDNELVRNADKISTAENAATRYEERKASAGRRDLEAVISDVIGSSRPGQKGEGRVSDGARPVVKPLRAEIIVGEFQSVLPGHGGGPFNFLHCDFPYGVNTGDKSGQSAAKSFGHYADSPDIYFNLLGELIRLTPTLVTPSAHMMFWFSMDYYNETKRLLEESGWRVLARPLIWHKSDNAGILPDPNRGPRQTYETALFCSRGDRKVVKAVANSYAGPTSRELHTSEKPRPVLNHFFRMFVDDSTRGLDPTAGSGNAVRVMSELGAEYALGIERDADFAALADANVKRSRVDESL